MGREGARLTKRAVPMTPMSNITILLSGSGRRNNSNNANRRTIQNKHSRATINDGEEESTMEEDVGNDSGDVDDVRNSDCIFQ
jgi:hypothetical protein